MTRLNRAFGAHLVEVLTGQYEDPEGQAVYYRIPLAAARPGSNAAGDWLRSKQGPSPERR